MTNEQLQEMRTRAEAPWTPYSPPFGRTEVIQLLDYIVELRIKAEVYRTALDAHGIVVEAEGKVLNDPRDRTTTHIIPEEITP